MTQDRMLRNCRLCGHEQFTALTVNCSCGCHKAMEEILALHHGDTERAKSRINDMYTKADMHLSLIERALLSEIAMKKHDPIQLTSLELYFVKQMMNKMGMQI